MGSEWQQLSWRPSPGPWLPLPLCRARDQETLTPALQLGPVLGPRASQTPCPPPPLGRPLRDGIGAVTLQHTTEHVNRSPGLGLSIHCHPCFSHPVGPAGFFISDGGPKRDTGPFPKHSQQQHSAWGQFPGIEQSPELPTSPLSWGPL